MVMCCLETPFSVGASLIILTSHASISSLITHNIYAYHV